MTKCASPCFQTTRSQAAFYMHQSEGATLQQVSSATPLRDVVEMCTTAASFKPCVYQSLQSHVQCTVRLNMCFLHISRIV